MLIQSQTTPKIFETTVTRCDTIAGVPVFDMADGTDQAFTNVSFDCNVILPLQPVHYHYINPTAKHPRKFAVIGEYSLIGKRISLLS